MDKNLIQTATAHISPEPVKQELSPSKSGVPSFEEALKYPKLKDASVASLQAILRRCMLLVGVRAANLPGDEERAILMQFIYKHYGNLTIAEIQLAFEKAVAGELETEANCYENFSPEYFGRIMTAYKQWASRQWNENQMYVPRETKQIEMNKKPDWKPLLELYYQDYLAGKFNILVMPYEVYGAAMELNYISDDAWEDWEGTANTVLIGQLQGEKFECMHEKDRIEIEEKISKILSGELSTLVENFAKKLAIEFLFQTAKKDKFQNLYTKI